MTLGCLREWHSSDDRSCRRIPAAAACQTDVWEQAGLFTFTYRSLRYVFQNKVKSCNWLVLAMMVANVLLHR